LVLSGMKGENWMGLAGGLGGSDRRYWRLT
jgi:hypothetical protein